MRLLRTGLVIPVVVAVTFTAVAATPYIERVVPDRGSIGDQIALRGTGFSAAKGDNWVTFKSSAGRVQAKVLWTRGAGALGVEVPPGSVTGPIIVEVGGQPSNGQVFTVVPAGTPAIPHIASITPNKGAVGEQVTIRGTGFVRVAEDNIVTFNGTKAADVPRDLQMGGVRALPALRVAVPEGATSGPLVVKVGSNTSNSVNFTVVAPPSPTAPPSGYHAVGSGGRRSSLVLDLSDLPYIAYIDQAYHIRYAAWDQTKGLFNSKSASQKAGVLHKASGYCGIPLVISNSDSMPWISYCESAAAKGLMCGEGYKDLSDPSWMINAAGPSLVIADEISLALTAASSKPCIAYSRGCDYKMPNPIQSLLGFIYLSDATGKWAWHSDHPKYFTDCDYAGLDMALDSNDVPRLVYTEVKICKAPPSGQKVCPGTVRYASRLAPSGWTYETIQDFSAEANSIEGLVGSLLHPSMVLDSGDTAFVTYSVHSDVPPFSPGQLRAAKRLWVLQWDTTAVVEKAITWGSALALNEKQDRLVVCYYEREYGKTKPDFMIKYVVLDSKSLKPVQNPTTVKQWPYNQVSKAFSGNMQEPYGVTASLALDSKGKIHISYYDLAGAILVYYKQP